MRKEYSDLPKNQKSTYISRQIIESVSSISLTIISIIIVFSQFSSMDETNADLLVISLLSILFLSMFIGTFIGVLICDKLNLYTDFELERTERRLAKIKEAIKQNSE